MPRLLVITYLYPPAGSVGVHRLLRFLKWLPRLGWEPVVLTPRNAKPANLQPSLVPAVAGIEAHRTYSFEALNTGRALGGGDGGSVAPSWPVRALLRAPMGLWRQLAVPDPKLGWVPFAVSAGARLIRERRVDAIYVSGKPFSSYLIAARLGRRFGIPWVMDVRDLWALNRRTPDLNRWHGWMNRRLERDLVRRAAVVITNTPGNRQEFIRGYPDHPPDKFVTITNGYDRDEFEGTPPAAPERFTIGYTGTFYFDRESRTSENIFESHSPLFLFRALKRLVEGKPELRRSCRVVIAGPRGARVLDMARQHELDDIVEVPGWVSHADALALQRSSHLLFAVLARGDESRSWVPAKLYQYLGAGTPILALVPEGDAARIVRDTGAGTVVPPDDVDGIEAAIGDAYERFQRGRPAPVRNEEAVRRYEAESLTRQLVRELDRIAGRPWSEATKADAGLTRARA